MQSRSEVKAGVVILAGGALSVVILAAAGRWHSFLAKKQTLHVVFMDVQGLKVSDPVQVMGLELGKVDRMEIVHDRDEAGGDIPAVEVTATLTYPEAFSADTRFVVSRSITGSTELSIEPGRSSLKLLPGQKAKGLAPVSMTDLANKAGLMAKRLDEFVTELTDRRMVNAVRGSLANLHSVSERAKSVMESLDRTIPGTEKSMVSSVKNLEQVSGELSRVVAGSKDRIGETVANIHAASQSVARLSENIDRMVAKDRDPVHHAVSNIDKATADIKSLTRQVRWQPWLLLHRPGKAEVSERGGYNEALEFSEGAESLNGTVKELMEAIAAAEAKGGPAAGDREKLKLLAGQVHDNLEKSVALERRLWRVLNDKSLGKNSKD